MIECQKLANKDVMSSSDPRVTVFLVNPKSNDEGKCMGATEVIKDDLNPKFQACIKVTYNVDAGQHLSFDVEDVDSSGSSDTIGSCSVDINQIIPTVESNTPTELTIMNGNRRCGTLILKPRVCVEPSGEIRISVKAERLDKKDFFGKSDPYLVFHDGQSPDAAVFLRTEVIKNTLSPVWDDLSFGYAFDNGAYLVECFDWNKMSKHELIGSCVITAGDLIKHCSHGAEWRVPLINEKKQAKSKKYENSGYLVFSDCIDLVALEKGVLDAIALGKCTFGVTERRYVLQKSWRCITCGLTEDKNLCVCESCISRCHANHQIVPGPDQTMFCDCPDNGPCKCN